ncbi:MAG: hypothetical protein A2086_13755 [Spirochaetes bacterium GWD1_27_9]|nr:MAG: hypothetical protein A2Z98_13190 [Spirochaetes bacterium GWB1_27_13]OHD42231.1 MAG: hypothetical protein A2086_13755 [Spirochaetes bacterium GWD1_27_9]
MKVLVVDDSTTIRFTLKAILSGMDYEVLEAASGEESIELFKKNSIDLITMDIEMDGIDGYEACSIIRQLEHERDSKSFIPIIFVTNVDTLEGRVKGFESGATSFITKPFNKQDIVNILEMIKNPKNIFAGVNILIVDDNVQSSNLVSSIIKEHGANVLTTSDGNNAIDFIRLYPDKVDLIITNYSLPKMNGNEVCAKIKNQLGLKKIPIIMMLKKEEQDKILDVFKVGCSDYITKPFIKEEFIARLNTHLEYFILNKALEHKIVELKRLNKLKDDFLAVCSHDLKSPLTGIIGFSNILLKKDYIQEHDKEFIKLIGTAGEFLKSVINNLLDIAKIQFEQTLEFSSINIINTIEDAAKPMTIIANSKQINLSIINRANTQLNVMGNNNALLRVFNNLLSNAIKFTQKDGVIEVVIDKINDNSKDFVAISVKDNGIGISKEKLNHLFDKFSKTSRPGTEGETGTGLGLSIVREIIEKHFGKIEVTSEINNGSNFKITLPMTS